MVADTISEALTTDEPKLRYPVGDDAHKWIAGRSKISDEGWVAEGREMPLDEWADGQARMFGVQI